MNEARIIHKLRSINVPLMVINVLNTKRDSQFARFAVFLFRTIRTFGTTTRAAAHSPSSLGRGWGRLTLGGVVVGSLWEWLG
jgi:hypothetical protein